jgi:hypothetical protein
MDEQAPKISLPEILLVAFAIFIFGLIDIVLPILGTVFNWAFTQIYLRMKGMKGSYQVGMLVSNGISTVASFIPGADLADPFIDTATFIAVAWMENHPSELTEVIKKAGEVVDVAEGEGVGEGAAAEGAEGAAAGAGASAAAEGSATTITEEGATVAAESEEVTAGTAAGAATAERPSTTETRPSERPAETAGEESGWSSGPEEEDESGEKSPEEEERRKKEEEMAKFFRQGEETPPEEQEMEELFPEEEGEDIPRVIDINRARRNPKETGEDQNDRPQKKAA